MDKDEIITAIANDLFSNANINDIISMMRAFCVEKATEIYENASDEEKAELEKQITAAKEAAEAAAKAASEESEKEVEEAEVEVVEDAAEVVAEEAGAPA